MSADPAGPDDAAAPQPSTTTGEPQPTAPPPTTAPSSTEPDERGTLRIADRVVERVAGYAVTQVPDATAAPRRMLGRTMGRPDADDRAKVRAEVHGGTANVHATIAVQWPESVRAVARAVRSRIREDLAHITGVTVDHVDIDVVNLPLEAVHTPRVR